ncbi:LamB/YcsF family protein [Paracoccaceae bacterium GXU_MW_L88]
MKLNLNSDLGESFGPWVTGRDAEMLEIVRAANLACGAHAGDPVVMRASVRDCVAKGVEIGAHPGFADLQGFGRRNMALTPEEITPLVAAQIGALQAVAALEGGTVTHVKPHGALNNMASVDRAMADAIAAGIKGVAPDLILLATATSELENAGRAAGLPVACEIFADRTYQADGTLTPRSQPNALIKDPAQSTDQILRFLEAGAIIPLEGDPLPTQIHSVCVHGDKPEAVALAAAVAKALKDQGITLTTLTDVMGQTRQQH